MSGLVNALVILAVVGLVIARQLRPRPVAAGGRWWLIPAVLAVLAIRDGGLVDSAHQGLSVALLGGELLIAAGMGVVWALTTRMWTAQDGGVWAQGTKATVTVWVLGIALRVGLYGAGAAAGVHQETGSVLLAVAVTLLIRAGVLLYRAQGLLSSYRSVA
ncbi:DUF1453 domain-containing protein [Actinacidiphila bryophytorum]|uniref:DUF1453 domain-containing protein n=1 Tax=Actinacidiphila bryophytorum TaxID=1436133 RepID=UPI002176DD10|nr:DUF1453 domain-containing protein [Actinacidiphila bryophytorum]UWE11760.1 DUF1453 domain-containing protein [Actinacidiphila bryophytorum]